jgi:hypothetical protein
MGIWFAEPDTAMMEIRIPKPSAPAKQFAGAEDGTRMEAIPRPPVEKWKSPILQNPTR